LPRPRLSLTLLSPGGCGEEINGPLLRRYAAARTSVELAAALAAMCGPQGFVDRLDLAGLEAVRALPGQTAKLVGIAEAISRGNRQGVIGKAALGRLRMPVAVMWGTDDPVLPYAQTGDLPAHFVLHGIDGAGHMLVEEALDRVLHAMRQLAR